MRKEWDRWVCFNLTRVRGFPMAAFLTGIKKQNKKGSEEIKWTGELAEEALPCPSSPPFHFHDFPFVD